MSSLYEPSIRWSANSAIGQRVSKRFTTLEGWREIGSGVYTMGSSNVRMFSFRHQFDPEHSRDDGIDFTQTLEDPQGMITRAGTLVEYRRSSEGTIGKAIGSLRDGKDNSTIREEEIATPYHVYTLKEKWALVVIVGVVGSFPTITFNMYLPALGGIATEFQTGSEAPNLTVMAYLLALGVAPLFWSHLSACVGRRPVYLIAISVYVTCCIVLSFSPNFAVLLVFRILQAASIASMVPIGYATIRDISPPAESDRFHNFFQGIRNGFCLLAPILGGLTSTWTDFRCMFVVLFALSLALCVVMAFVLPETLRSIAGNGTIPLAGIHQSLVWKCKIFGRSAYVDDSLQPAPRPNLEARRFLDPLRLCREKDILLSLVFSSMVYMIWMMVTISTPSLFKEAFALNEVLIGVAFIPNFLGAIAGSTLIGNLLDEDLKHACLQYKRAHFIAPNTNITWYLIQANFPIEHVRLARIPIFIILFILPLSGYGYTLAYPSLNSLGGWICIPLLLQFLIAASAHAICGVLQTLISELWPGDGSGAASTITNLMRSIFSAIGAAIIQKILDYAETGPTFLAFGIIVMVLVPLPIVQWYLGESWRAVRGERMNGRKLDPVETTKA